MGLKRSWAVRQLHTSTVVLLFVQCFAEHRGDQQDCRTTNQGRKKLPKKELNSGKQNTSYYIKLPLNF